MQVSSGASEVGRSSEVGMGSSAEVVAAGPATGAGAAPAGRSRRRGRRRLALLVALAPLEVGEAVGDELRHVVRVWPSFSYWRVWMRPSTKTLLPLRSRSAARSAVLAPDDDPEPLGLLLPLAGLVLVVAVDGDAELGDACPTACSASPGRGPGCR